MARVSDWNGEQLRILRNGYADRFDFWYVRSAGQRVTTWHAKPVGATVATLDAGSPEGLVKLLAKASLRPAG